MKNTNEDLNNRFEFRDILPEEAEQAAIIENICFPPNEACTETMMKERVAVAPDLFRVAVDKETGKTAGFLNGLATNEHYFRADRDWQRQSYLNISAENMREAEKCCF